MAEKKTDSGIILIEEEAESTEVELTQSSKSSIIQGDGEVTKEDSGIIIVDKETKGAEEDPPQSAETSIIVASDLLPTSLIIVPLFDRPFFPKMMVPILLSNEELVNNILESLNDKQKYVGLLFAEETEGEGESFKVQRFAKVGVAGKVMQINRKPDAPAQLLVQCMERFEVVELSETSLRRARVRYWYDDPTSNDEEVKAYSISIISCIKELVQLKPLFREELSLLMGNINLKEPGTLADFSSSMTTSSGEELQKILGTRPLLERAELALILLKKELEISKIQVQINKRIEDRLSTQQRQFFLKEQLKEIKKELGLSKDDKESEEEKFRKRIEVLTLTEEASERIEEELEKLRLLEPSSPEFNVTRAYLDWLTVLPWGKTTEDNEDIEQAEEILQADHYGLEDVKDRILELISVGMMNGNLSGTIILLVGPPGVGKTSIGQSIARSLNREFYRFSVGGMRDEAEIKGHRRTYIGALPGKFVQALKVCKSSNPVLMLDEVDKIGSSFRGDPASALLEVLDPEQNKDFLDHYLDVRFDLSKVLFICTANQQDTIPGPLLDRMEVIRLSGYILEEKLQIARRHLIERQLSSHGLKPEEFQIDDNTLREVIDGYAREAGVRNLEKQLKKMMRKAARQIVTERGKENPKTEVQINKEDLKEYLGKRSFTEEQAFTEPKVGVVMGLAYTALGGATLHIEARSIFNKNGGLKQTGQLGDVMKESAEIAYSYVRSLLQNDPDAKEFFEEKMIHLHVPAGATPKDGPSAGITMACALTSLIFDTPLKAGLAMTGELTLTGVVLPIGGVKEKTIAARRAKISELVFPADNQEDFEDLDDSVREGITAHFVKKLEDVLAIGFPNLKWKQQIKK
ncbi:MAG: endopeptidase La [SAR324 cluster bacterium]|nr:endopeptidase La [SAR324 cluster bacterium]